MANRDVFQEISDSIAAQLEKGVRPWAKPWTSTGSYCPDLPHNIEGRPYRGANVFWLMLIGHSRGYESSLWLTFNQAKARGGAVKKGETGTPVFFWKPFKTTDKATGEEKMSFMSRSFTVFHISQTEGVKLPEKVTIDVSIPDRNNAADALIAATGARIRHGGDRAYFSPSQDFIAMPEPSAFHDTDDYYCTLFHELGHWTGHETRLKREFGKRFGDAAYAMEELVAELTSAFVCGSQGFVSTEREDHAAYIGMWAAKLKEDPKAFITAAGRAQAAADLILGVKAYAAATEEDTAQAA